MIHRLLKQSLHVLSRRKRADKVPEWVTRGELTAKGTELSYWKKAGLAKGPSFYKKYLDAFGLEVDAFSGECVGDFGCGPFGGILCALTGLKQAYPIDVLADEYNDWALSPYPIRSFDGRSTPVPAGACDVMFSANALDHTPDPTNSISEIFRVLKPGGKLFVHVHLRGAAEINKAHPVAWSRESALHHFRKFSGLSAQEFDRDEINGVPMRMLLLSGQKPDRVG